MIETIQFKRGLEANLPRLADGEPAFCEDTQNVYIGSSSGNKLVFSGSLTDYLNKLGDLTQLQTTDKDTLVHAINDNVASLAQILQQVVNVKNPPAPLVGTKGDGSTDDTIAINNIIANSTGRRFYFPAGTYLVQYISFTTGVHLLGDGFDKTIIKRINGYNVTTFDTAHPEKGNLLGNTTYNYSTRENVSLEGICFDGNVQNAVMNGSQSLVNMFNNVQLYYLDNLFIKNCWFKNSIGDGLFLGGVRNAVIESSHFDHCGYNVSSGTSTRNCFSTFGGYYNNTTSTSSIVETNTIIRECYFNDAHDMGVVTRNPKSLTIENCEFTNLVGNLELYGDSQSTDTEFNTFDNKIIVQNNTFNGGTIGHGDVNRNYKEVLVFKGNTVKSSANTFTFSTDGSYDNFLLLFEDNDIEIDRLFFSNIGDLKIRNNKIKCYTTTSNALLFLSMINYHTISDNHIMYKGTANNSLMLGYWMNVAEVSIINNNFEASTSSTLECIKFNASDSTTIMIENMRILGNKLSGYNRGINISSAVDNSILINSNIFDVPATPDYCVYQWTGNCKKAVAIGNIGINNTQISLNATTKNISNNV